MLLLQKKIKDATCLVLLPVVKILGDDIYVRLNIPDNFVTLVADVVYIAQVTVSPHNLDHTFASELSQHRYELANTTCVVINVNVFKDYPYLHEPLS